MFVKCTVCQKYIFYKSKVCPHCGKFVESRDVELEGKSPFAKIIYAASHEWLHPIWLGSIIAVTVMLRSMGLHSSFDADFAFIEYLFLLVCYVAVTIILVDKTMGTKETKETYEKNRKIFLCIVCVVLLCSTALTALHAIKRDYVLENMPSSGIVHVKAHIDAEYYTTLEEGFASSPYAYLVVDEEYFSDHSILEIELGKNYEATVRSGYSGSSNRIRGEGEKDVQLIVTQSMLREGTELSTEFVLNEYDFAVVVISFEWFPTFWDVIFF